MSADGQDRSRDSQSLDAHSDIVGSSEGSDGRPISLGDHAPRHRDGRPAVLLVDDRAENLLALEALLESLPVRLVRAMSAVEALARVEEEQFALILLDVQMPGTDGLQAARLIKARERGAVAPILFITAQNRERRRVTTAYEAGAVDYLFKPLDPDELRAKVAAFLDLHRMHAEDRDRRRRYADRLIFASEERSRDAAETARRALTAAHVADRSKAEFLARMSHELRTPLNAILGYVHLLDLGILGVVTVEQHTQLNRVRQSAVHLIGLVNDIFDFITLDTEQIDIARVEGEINDICDEALAVVRIDAVLRSLAVVGLPTSDPSGTYLGDPIRVRQVLVHLLTNAVKFTPPGGKVTLSCGTSAEGARHPDAPSSGPWAFVRVADTGPGIKPADLECIFEPFTQADGGFSRPQGGIGLGLAISRRLARAMGGNITVQSEPGRGATFTLWLPAPEAHAPSASATPIRPHAAEAAASTAARMAPPPTGRVSSSGAAAAPERAPSPIYVRLTALGTTLAMQIERIAGEHAARLREESLPNVDGISETQLRDHVSTFLNEIAHVLRATGESEARAPELLRDGSEILRLVSELHGAQRERLDWEEGHVEREIEMLGSEIEQHLRTNPSRDDADAHALAQALLLVQRLLEQSRQASCRGFRLARRGRPNSSRAR